MVELGPDFPIMGGSFACVDRKWEFYSTCSGIDEAFTNWLEKRNSSLRGDKEVDLSFGVDSIGQKYNFMIDHSSVEGEKFYIEFNGKYHRIIQVPSVEDDKTA